LYLLETMCFLQYWFKFSWNLWFTRNWKLWSIFSHTLAVGFVAFMVYSIILYSGDNQQIAFQRDKLPKQFSSDGTNLIKLYHENRGREMLEQKLYEEGQVKNLWLFWDNTATVPPFVNACFASFLKNATEFNIFLLTTDDIDKHGLLQWGEDTLEKENLPPPTSQWGKAMIKDALLYSVMSKYGGLAIDVTSVVFPERLSKLWDEMIAEKKQAVIWKYDKSISHSCHGFQVSTAVWCIGGPRGSEVFKSYVSELKATPPQDGQSFDVYESYGAFIFDKTMKNNPKVMYKNPMDVTLHAGWEFLHKTANEWPLRNCNQWFNYGFCNSVLNMIENNQNTAFLKLFQSGGSAKLFSEKDLEIKLKEENLIIMKALQHARVNENSVKELCDEQKADPES